MMNINWLVRVKSLAFWVAVIPAVLLLVQAVLVLFGIQFDIEPLNSQLIAIVDALFVVLMILGIVNDPTVKGLGDSELTMIKTEPVNLSFEDLEEVISDKRAA